MIFYVNNIRKKNDIIVKNSYFLYSIKLFQDYIESSVKT